MEQEHLNFPGALGIACWGGAWLGSTLWEDGHLSGWVPGPSRSLPLPGRVGLRFGCRITAHWCLWNSADIADHLQASLSLVLQIAPGMLGPDCLGRAGFMNFCQGPEPLFFWATTPGRPASQDVWSWDQQVSPGSYTEKPTVRGWDGLFSGTNTRSLGSQSSGIGIWVLKLT